MKVNNNMVKVVTDKKKIEEVLSRGVEMIFPDKDSLKKLLLKGKRIRLYCGYDPSAAALHIGNAISINKLSQLQELGHEVIMLIGDFTGMIGDPTDKLAVRTKMSRAKVLKNAEDYQKQASAYLRFDGDNPAKIMYNSEWSDKLTFKDLIELSSNFTVQQMIQRDMFQKRIKEEKPIYLHEFLYPLAQGYDSVAMDVDLEIGGNDQMFNMMAGRELQKAVNGREKFVMTLKLLADDTGKKMGKSEGNAVFLDEEPNNMYGVIMSWPDGVIGAGFELCTRIPMEEVQVIRKALHNDSVNPRDLKMRLAREIVALNYGQGTAEQAEENFISTIQRKEIPKDLEIYTALAGEYLLYDLLLSSGLVLSKNDARRLIKQGAVKVNEKIIDDINWKILVANEPIIIQKGKRFFIKIVKK